MVSRQHPDGTAHPSPMAERWIYRPTRPVSDRGGHPARGTDFPGPDEPNAEWSGTHAPTLLANLDAQRPGGSQGASGPICGRLYRDREFSRTPRTDHQTADRDVPGQARAQTLSRENLHYPYRGRVRLSRAPHPQVQTRIALSAAQYPIAKEHPNIPEQRPSGHQGPSDGVGPSPDHPVEPDHS